MDHTPERAHLAWRRAERIRRLSDDLVRIGPFGLGLDGVLAWIPAAGTFYSVGAAALLFVEAIHAGAANTTLLKMAAYLGFNSAASAVPIVGSAVDTLFRGHAMSARALQKDIERRYGRPAPDPAAERAARPRFGRPRTI